MADFMSFDNLKLAWVRTLSGENTDYRSLQRIEIDSFGWAEDDNLRQLQKELSENVFSPSQTTKIYIPKPSGLLRPITVLRVLDTIVYQAIANRLAERARTHLSEYYLRSAFSNILTSAKGYPFFYRKWKFGRDRLDRERERVFRQGYQWIGELDLASFYDVIDHTLLRSILVDLCHEEECLQRLFSCLSKWTIHRIGGFQHGHGIPQGPLASSFLAECVLHYLDSRLTRLDNAVYFRYVDNITLLATNERDAKKVMAKTEMVCRELGLVPQVKRHIEKPRDLENLMFQEASPLEGDSSNVAETSPKQNAVLRKMFLGCFRGPKINTADEHLASKLNYSLFKMNPDRRVINKVLGLLYALPSVADAVTFYLRKFGGDADICGHLFAYLDGKPIYDYVNARCLETIYACCVHGQFTRLSRTCEDFLSKQHNTIVRSAATKILGLRRIKTRTLSRMMTQDKDTYLREHLLVALSASFGDRQKQQLLNRFVRVDDPHLALVSSYLLTSANLKLEGAIPEIHAWATPILASRGLTKKRVTGDRLGQILRTRYEIKLSAGYVFRGVFSRRQYKQALLHVDMAEGGFATNRSLWATQMDNFNQIILTLLYKKIGLHVVKGNEFGSLASVLLRTNFPNAAAVFEKCHAARLSNPVPHAYSRLLGTFPRDIKPRERDALRKELKVAYQEFVDKY